VDIMMIMKCYSYKNFITAGKLLVSLITQHFREDPV
jgi:hypothetical protein